MSNIITDIRKKSERSKLYIVSINYEDSFAIYNSELIEYGLYVDDEIDDIVIHKIYSDILAPRGYKRALNIIIKRSVSIYEMRQKLSKDYYPDEVIDGIIDKLIKDRFLDDRRYAESYISYYSQNKSIGTIRRELSLKGIDKEVIDEIIEDDDIIDSNHEYDLCMKLLTKKYNNENGEYAYILKAKQYLYRKGFAMDVIDRCVSDFFV